ncbi:hypothetical protein [Yersinia enterocolitica]|uniref:hypothetical protein n=1 Tax=Yersinia enterocolitica TaxID=630 RepID=UPI0038B9C86D
MTIQCSLVTTKGESMMNKKNEIWKLWQSRDEQQRTGHEAEKLADEAWSLGLRLALHPQTHYQLVMELVR